MIIKSQKDVYSFIELVNKMINSKSKKLLKSVEANLFMKKQKNNTHLLVLLYLNKNIETISIAERLINNDNFDEALCLMRMALERVAIATKALVENISTNEIEKISGNQCISFLKKYFDIGNMYGFYSKFAHSNAIPSLHSYIISFYNTRRRNRNLNEHDLNIYFKLELFLLREINLYTISLLYKNYVPAEVKYHKEVKRVSSYTPEILKSAFATVFNLYNNYRVIDPNTSIS